MATVQMDSKTGFTGNLTLGAPSGATVAVVNGVGTVNPQDVPAAIAQSWIVLANQPWPSAKLIHATIPVAGAWPSSGVVTFPDGSTATITAGAALIPIAWWTWARQMGWSATPGYGSDGV